MRILYLSGLIRDQAYKDGEIDTRETGMPSIWNIILKFAEHNSDRAYFYIAALKRSKTPGKVEYLPLNRIRGTLMVFHVSTVNRIDLHSHLFMAPEIVNHFSYNGTVKPVDAVMLPSPNMAKVLHYWLGNRQHQKHRPLLGVRTCDLFLETGLGTEYNYYHNADYTFFSPEFQYVDRIFTNGHHMKPVIMSELRKTISPAALRKVEEKFEYISHGIPIFDQPLDFNRGRVVGYFGRFDNETKKVDWCFDVFDKAYKAGYVDEVIATSSLKSDANSSALKGRDYVQFSAERQDYVLIAQRARATITNYTGISCPLAMLEQMGYGIVPLVPADKMWVKHFFREEFPDYPFQFTSQEEALAMIKALMDNDDLYKTWAKRLSERVREGYEIRTLKRRMFDSLMSAYDETTQPIYMRMDLDELLGKYQFLHTVKEMAEERDKIDLEEFFRELTRVGAGGKGAGGVELMSTVGIFRFLKLLGFKDTLDSPVPLLVREG